VLTDKSLGTDKITYLFQDHCMTGAQVSAPTEYRMLIHYLGFSDDRLVLEEKGVNFAQALQQFYFDMWTQVYLRKQSLCVERMLQKAIQLHLQDESLDPDMIFMKSEGWVDTQLEESRNPVVRDLHRRIRERDSLRVAVSFKLEDYVRGERVAEKPIAVVPSKQTAVMGFLDYYENPLHLTRLESKIAKALEMRENDLVIAVAPEPGKLVPEDIHFVDKTGADAGSLFERLPKNKQFLQGKANNFFAVSIIVPDANRRRVSQAANNLTAIVQEDSGISL